MVEWIQELPEASSSPSLPDMTASTDGIVCYLDLNPLDVLKLRETLPKLGHTGGYVSFEGIVRDTNHGRIVTQLEYEAFLPLAKKELKAIASHAKETFRLAWVRAVHRVGVLGVGETAVVIQVLSRHRQEAFEGCHFIIDQIKARVPIWKKEFYADGTSNWTRCHDHDHTPSLTHEGD